MVQIVLCEFAVWFECKPRSITEAEVHRQMAFVEWLGEESIRTLERGQCTREMGEHERDRPQ